MLQSGHGGAALEPGVALTRRDTVTAQKQLGRIHPPGALPEQGVPEAHLTALTQESPCSASGRRKVGLILSWLFIQRSSLCIISRFSPPEEPWLE